MLKINLMFWRGGGFFDIILQKCLVTGIKLVTFAKEVYGFLQRNISVQGG